MILKAWMKRACWFCVSVLWLSPAIAQQAAMPTNGGNLPSQGYVAPASPPAGYAPQQAAGAQQFAPRQQLQLAERTNPLPDPSRISLDRRPGEHPLMPALRWASHGLQQMEANVRDYSSIVVKRERGTNGQVGEEEWMLVKIRHKPFSVYMRFLRPRHLDGQEVIYVQGANDGKMWAHGVGMRALAGTVSIKPTSVIAMQGQHYPITEMGMKNLIQRLLEVGSQDSQYGECDVKFLEGALVNERTCTCIEVRHPVPRSNFRFHLARIYVDNERNMPIRYEAYDWPKAAGGPPELIEEYTYLDVRLNPGFTDGDFDIRNPNYRFREGR